MYCDISGNILFDFTYFLKNSIQLICKPDVTLCIGSFISRTCLCVFVCMMKCIFYINEFTLSIFQIDYCSGVRV